MTRERHTPAQRAEVIAGERSASLSAPLSYRKGRQPWLTNSLPWCASSPRFSSDVWARSTPPGRTSSTGQTGAARARHPKSPSTSPDGTRPASFLACRAGSDGTTPLSSFVPTVLTERNDSKMICSHLLCGRYPHAHEPTRSLSSHSLSMEGHRV